MSSLPVRLIVKNYDHVAPLASGDVAPEGIELDLVRDTIGALPRTVNDLSFGAGEHSLSRHVLRLANGDRSFVGIPIFPVRNFRHRCFWVRRGSDIHTLEDLAGRRVGTDEWSATGNVWSRAALRDVGVESEQIEWLVGPVDGSAWREWSVLPPFARFVEEGQDLHAMLLAGEIDAIVCPNPPSGVLEPDSPIVRLVPDYRDAEHSYFGRIGYYPAHHLMGVRRELYEREPWVLRSLYTAFEASKQLWLKERRHLGDTTPWLLADIEETMAMMGRDWQENGVEANVAMTQGLCDEQLAQGVLSKPFDARELFAEFEEAMGR